MRSSLAYHHKALFGAYRILSSVQRSTRLYSSSSSGICTSCGASLPTRLPACPKCFHIERPINKYDYYELLETPKHPNPFIINETQLKNNFRHVQRHVHPDLWASQGQDKTQVARDLSGLVNIAYNTLLRPLSRIHYILSQHNRSVSETDQLNDPHLITEIIEIREALDDASSESEVEEIKNDVTGKILATLKKIENAVLLESWDEAHQEAVRLKYLRGIEAATQSWPNAPPGDH